MKRTTLILVSGLFTMGLISCGSGHPPCPAYHKSDYVKYKTEHPKKISEQKKNI